jgi:hypothetical protein
MPRAAVVIVPKDVRRLRTWSERLRSVATVVVLLALVTALLCTFGYATSQARFGYFGVDASALAMSTLGLVLQSVSALYIPLLGLLAAVVAGYLLHGWVRDNLAAGTRRRLLRRLGWGAVVLGGLLLLRALFGILVASAVETEFPGTTPLCLGLGASAAGYGAFLLHATREDEAPDTPAAARVVRAVAVLLGAIVVVSLFWTAHSFASAYGRSQAAADSTRLRERPDVVLDTTERLYLRFPGVEETALPLDEGQRSRFRYRGLRLLIEANGSMFLLPERWSEGGGVLVLPHDGSVRAQFGPGAP